MSKTPDFKVGSVPEQPNVGPAGMIGRLWSRALGRLLRLSIDETRVATRGFSVDSPEMVKRLEGIGASFAHGYNSAIRSASLNELMSVLQDVPLVDSGFVFEGAAMGLAVTDWMTPNRRRFEAFVAGPANHHEYMVWVGLGWSFARLPASPIRALRRYSSINKWLALDGYGFHEGYFGWRKSISQQRRPRSFVGSEAKVFDQGLGRSLWFVFGANPIVVARAIEAFEHDRQSDLWSGVGLAASYVGGVDSNGLTALCNAAGRHAAALGQGVIFAAEARRRAGNAVPHSELACQIILGLGVPEAAEVALRYLPPNGHDIESYQRWRLDIQDYCARRQKGTETKTAIGPGE